LSISPKHIELNEFFEVRPLLRCDKIATRCVENISIMGRGKIILMNSVVTKTEANVKSLIFEVAF